MGVHVHLEAVAPAPVALYRLIRHNMDSSDLVAASIAITSYRRKSPGLGGLSLRTNELICDNLDDEAVSKPAEQFILSSKMNEWDRDSTISILDYFQDPMITAYGKLDQDWFNEGESFALASSNTPQMQLDEAIKRRRSVRRYTGDPIDQSDLSSLLRYSSGITGKANVARSDGNEEVYYYRAVSSGGGLYPVEVYVAVKKVKGLPSGIYRYSPRNDALVVSGGEDDVSGLMAGLSVSDDQLNIDGASVVFILVGVPWRSMRKYGSRGLRFVFHEVGAISENIQLVSAALGIGATDCSSYYDDVVNQALGLDGQHKFVADLVIAGIPA